MPVVHVERRTSHELDHHPIPAMTDPQGRGWEQPPRDRIVIDDRYALMTLADFEALHDYSGSRPSGVYPGKMWRRHDGAFDREFIARGGKPVWMLCWYGLSEHGPDYCSNNHRIIVLSDANVEDIDD